MIQMRLVDGTVVSGDTVTEVTEKWLRLLYGERLWAAMDAEWRRVQWAKRSEEVADYVRSRRPVVYQYYCDTCAQSFLGDGGRTAVHRINPAGEVCGVESALYTSWTTENPEYT